MKKLLFIAALSLFTSCGDDEASYDVPAQINQQDTTATVAATQAQSSSTNTFTASFISMDKKQFYPKEVRIIESANGLEVVSEDQTLNLTYNGKVYYYRGIFSASMKIVRVEKHGGYWIIQNTYYFAEIPATGGVSLK